MRILLRCLCLALAGPLLGGCSSEPQSNPRTDTGAGAVAKSFFDALVRDDWLAAYDLLDPESRAWCASAQFVSRAQAFKRQIGFTPIEVSVAVTETGDHASAVAVYREGSGTGSRQYKDGAALRKNGQGWAIVLRGNFGIAAPVPPARRTKNG
jgi:hypothetical protein